MNSRERLYFLDNLRTFLIFLVVLYHAGLVYEASGFAASFWVVDDPSTSNLPGLLNLVLDIFIMPTIFFISGFFSPSSLERKGPWRFLQSKFRRLIIPWVIAVFTLIPLYKVIFLYSRGLPQESWTKTPLIDFQNERLVPYFLVFLLGSLCFRLEIFDTDKRNMKLYIAVNATAWIPINIYLVMLLNYIFRPGEYLISEGADLLLLWFGFHLSMLALLYCAVTTFKYFFNRQGRLGRELGRLSYNVYIIHIAVMGPIALALLTIDIPAILKYPILTLMTFAASNLIAYAYANTKIRLTAKVSPINP